MNLNELAGIDLNKLYELNFINISPSMHATNVISKLKESYPNVFSSEVGKIPNFQAKLKIKKGSQPVFIKHRSVPFAIREEVEKEITK